MDKINDKLLELLKTINVPLWTKNCCLWNVPNPSWKHHFTWQNARSGLNLNLSNLPQSNIIKKIAKEIDILLDYFKTGLPAIETLLWVLQTDPLRSVNQFRNWSMFILGSVIMLSLLHNEYPHWPIDIYLLIHIFNTHFTE